MRELYGHSVGQIRAMVKNNRVLVQNGMFSTLFEVVSDDGNVLTLKAGAKTIHLFESVGNWAGRAA